MICNPHNCGAGLTKLSMYKIIAPYPIRYYYTLYAFSFIQLYTSYHYKQKLISYSIMAWNKNIICDYSLFTIMLLIISIEIYYTTYYAIGSMNVNELYCYIYPVQNGQAQSPVNASVARRNCIESVVNFCLKHSLFH